LDADERDADRLQHVDGEEGAPPVGVDGRQIGKPVSRQVQRVAEDHEQAKPADTLHQRRRPSHVRSPAPAGRDAERKPAEQQKQARRQPPLELPDVEPAAHLVARRQ
jgi:hypothetical protein